MHQESVRARIQASKLLDRLHADAMGDIALTEGQRASAIYLLTQAIGKPHQSMAIEHTHNHVSELTDEQLGDIATRGGTGTATKAPRPLNS
jgi:uncharacterized protein YjiS (DUF1127 family)